MVFATTVELVEHGISCRKLGLGIGHAAMFPKGFPDFLCITGTYHDHVSLQPLRPDCCSVSQGVWEAET